MENKKSEIKSIIQYFRVIIEQYGFRYKKPILKNVKRMVRRDEKTDNDQKEDDVEYLESIIDKLIKLKKHWTKKKSVS